jgi:hypothetical protein
MCPSINPQTNPDSELLLIQFLLRVGHHIASLLLGQNVVHVEVKAL